ncbi:MAG TPA: NAD-dependent epimerase/dehydratase family protein, partial [Myxococcales bacterium]|nr:NAD-dependent epimerase/dehydratase family protein [Myxococcales bacterium]
MRALVTGANGFLGTWLTRRLVSRGDEVRVVVRSSADEWGLSRLPIQRFQGDITDPASLRPAAQGVDVVFHLAGIRRAPSKEIFDRVNGEGTRHVCEAAVAGGAKRVVLCGSLAANGPSTPDRPRLESDPFAPFEWYGMSKAESERIAFGYRDRLEVVSARPSRIVGPGDRENLTFFKLVKRGWKVAVGGRPR